MVDEFLLPEDYTYSEISTEHRNERTVHVKEITDEESARIWLQKLSDISYVTWRSLRGYVTNGTKVIFKHTFRCQHCQKFRNRPMKGKEKTIRSSKNTDCEAELVITVRRIKKGSRINPKDLALLKVYPTVVIFKKDHNHVLTSPSILKYRPLSAAVKDKIRRLFKIGYSPPDAVQVHKMDLQMEYGENFSDVAGDGRLMPSVSEAYHLFAKLSKTDELPVRLRPLKKMKSVSDNVPVEDTMLAQLKIYLAEYQKETEGKVRFQQTICGNYHFAVVCTPLMVRAHQLKQSGELILVDAWGGSNTQKHGIYLMATPTAAGGVPLGVIVTDSVHESVFREALMCLKDVLCDWGFYSRKQPEVILSDASELNALREAFPNSKCLLCQSRVLKAASSWICDPNNDVEENLRKEAFDLFRKLLHSMDATTADERLCDLITFAEENCRIYGHYVRELYGIKEDWVSCYRQGLPIHRSDTNYVVVVLVRIFKDVIFHRTKTFNLLQLLDFIVMRLEDYMRHRLHDFNRGRYSRVLLEDTVGVEYGEANFEIKRTDYEFIYNVVEIHDNVDNLSDPQGNLVDLEAEVCSCAAGRRGQLCRHSTAVILLLEEEKVNKAHRLFCERTHCLFVGGGEPHPSGVPAQSSDEHFFSNAEIRKSHPTVPSVSVMRAPRFEDEELEGLWKSFKTRLANSVEDDPTVFKPALSQFFKNLETHCRTEEELARALYSFGTFSSKRGHS